VGERLAGHAWLFEYALILLWATAAIVPAAPPRGAETDLASCGGTNLQICSVSRGEVKKPGSSKY
jgi:hypothetical protein